MKERRRSNERVGNDVLLGCPAIGRGCDARAGSHAAARGNEGGGVLLPQCGGGGFGQEGRVGSLSDGGSVFGSGGGAIGDDFAIGGFDGIVGVVGEEALADVIFDEFVGGFGAEGVESLEEGEGRSG